MSDTYCTDAQVDNEADWILLLQTCTIIHMEESGSSNKELCGKSAPKINLKNPLLQLQVVTTHTFLG